tara:strand:- start:6438 stop:8519 length:2082 start_codon:yes stop_codon:yes gene_type:complete
MAIPFLNHINLSNNEVQNVRLHNTASITVSSGLGQLYFDTDDSLAKYYRANNDWVTIDPITSISLSGNTLTLGRVQADLTQDLSSLGFVDGSGTAGQVAFWSDSDTITGENDFGWDSTNNRLGIGVGLSPTANIEVKRSISDLATTLAHTDTKAVAKFIGSTNGDGQLTISHGSGAVQNIQSSNQAGTTAGYLAINPFGGSVSIGAAIGYHPLYVAKGASVSGTSIAVFENLASTAGSIKIANSEGSHSLRTDGGAFDIYDHGNNRITATISSAGALTLHQYGSGTHTGTEAKNLSVTSSGLVIETTPPTNTDTLQSIADSNSSSEQFVTFVANATGAQTGLSDPGIKYIPSSATLKVTNLIVSGDQTISNETVKVVEDNTLQFEGASGSNADTELNLTTATLTGGDKTVTLKNESGTIALISDIPTVNDATLTVQGTGVLGGSGTFTANDADATTISITHDAVTRTNNTSSASPGYGATFTAIDSITTSTEGHVTAVNTKTVTLPASDNTDTQLSSEQVQDIVGAMFSGNTETNITATYQDSDGTIDLVATDTNTQLTTEQVQDIVGAMFSSNTETRISASYQDSDGTIDLVVDDMTSDTNTQLGTKHVTIDVSVMDDTTSNRTAEITHSFDSSYVIVQLYDIITGQIVYADIDHISTDRVDITFAEIPSNDIRVIMIDASTGIAAASVAYS